MKAFKDTDLVNDLNIILHNFVVIHVHYVVVVLYLRPFANFRIIIIVYIDVGLQELLLQISERFRSLKAHNSYG